MFKTCVQNWPFSGEKGGSYVMTNGKKLMDLFSANLIPNKKGKNC